MGKRANYNKLAQQEAWYKQIAKVLDENPGRTIKSVSWVDYLNILIDEGEIKPYTGTLKPVQEDNAASFKKYTDWANGVLKKMGKNGVTDDSLTPGFDSKRKIFVGDIGMPSGNGSLFNPLAPSIRFENGRAVEWASNSLFKKGENGLPFYLGNRFSQSARALQTSMQIDRAKNVWGSASQYKPFPIWAANLTQSQARKAFPSKPEELIKNAQKKALDDDIQEYKKRFKDIIATGQIPDGNDIEEYLRFEASQEFVKLFDYAERKAKRVGYGFDDFNSYRQATDEQIKSANLRSGIETRLNIIRNDMKYLKSEIKSDAKNKAFSKGMFSVGAGLLSGGIFSSFGTTKSLASLAGISEGVAGGALTGATVGGVNGGVEGALKGAISGGIGSYAIEAYNNAGGISGIADLGNAADLGVKATGAPDLGSTSYNPLPTAEAALAGDYSLTPYTGNTFLDNLGATMGASSALTLPDIGVMGSGLLSFGDKVIESGVNNASDNIAEAVVGGDSLNNQTSTINQSSINNQAPNGGSEGIGTIGGRTSGVFGNNRVTGQRFERTNSPSLAYKYSGGIRKNTRQPVSLLNEPQKRI